MKILIMLGKLVNIVSLISSIPVFIVGWLLLFLVFACGRQGLVFGIVIGDKTQIINPSPTIAGWLLLSLSIIGVLNLLYVIAKKVKYSIKG